MVDLWNRNNSSAKSGKKQLLTWKVFCLELFVGWRRLTGWTCCQAMTVYWGCLEIETMHFRGFNQKIQWGNINNKHNLQPTLTCYLSHSVEDLEFVGIEGWYAIVLITLRRQITSMKHRHKYLMTYWMYRNLRCSLWKVIPTRTRMSCIYPFIPVTRKCRLPWILVQFMKLSMLLASTVCLFWLPVPRHAMRKMRRRKLKR